MTTVIILKGKGKDASDTAEIKFFSTEEEAVSFVDKVSDLESKYWTHAQIINESQVIETYYPEHFYNE